MDMMDTVTREEQSTAPADRGRLRAAMILPAMVVPLIASLLYFVLLAGTAVAAVIYAATKVFTVVWPGVVAVTVERVPLRPGPVDWRRHASALPLGLFTGLLVGGAIVAAYALTPLGDAVATQSEMIVAKVTALGLAHPARFIVFGCFLSFIHSGIEELFWRWCIFGRLRRIVAPAAAWLLAAASFAAHHYVVLGSMLTWPLTLLLGTGVGVGGLLWCWMYQRQRTLAGAWLSHALVDVAILSVGYHLVFL